MDRRTFLQGLTATAAAAPAVAAPAAARTGRVLGANDRINVATIGVGGRGSYVTGEFQKAAGTSPNQIVAVCDVYQKRVSANKGKFACDGTLDYREVLDRSDVDAVVVATPDHWHAKIALEAMAKGKDVYLEKPMCHTVDEAHQLVEMVKKTGRVLQVGSQTTSGDQWAKARQVISDGMLGKMLMSQGSYHRNSVEGEWNWPIDAQAGPDGKGDDFIDWKMWLGPAEKRAYNADRFFRFRKYWDYSGGIATDLFFHVAAPMNVCWGEAQFPSRVVGSGGIYEFKDEREVPDTFHLIGEYPKGHSVILTSCMANSQHIPGLIRGHGATLTMVEHGRFEGAAAYITLKAETRGGKFIVPELEAKFKGEPEIKIPVAEVDTMQAHVNNFLGCIRSRQKPQLDVETAARAQVLISMAVRSYRESQVQYFDDRTWKVSMKAPKA